MTQNDGNGDGPAKPPDGLLAEAVLANDEIVSPMLPVSPALIDTPSPAVVDPNYIEPTPLEAYINVRNKISCLEDGGQRCVERGSLINFLIERIEVLEGALMPFATQAVVLSNAHMCLVAAGRPNEPAGGTWYSNPPQGIQMQATEGLFFNAIDALGRGHVEDHMASMFQRMQERVALQTQKDVAVESGESVH